MGSRDGDTISTSQIMYGSMSRPNHRLPNGIDSSSNSIQHGSDAERVVKAMSKQPMSALRRTFCLLALFDLILTTILWLLFTEVKADGHPQKAFKSQVYDFTFRTSLFDTVMLSTFRFAVLTLSYGLFRSKYPWVVAVTTFVTSVYMLVKIVLYHYDSKGSASLEILDYLVLISSVIIAWVETWLLDLKVLPHEKKELERMLAAAAERQAAEDYSERSPLLSRFLRPARGDESFYSPVHSDAEDSEDENRSFHSTLTSRRSQSRNSLASITSQSTHYRSVIDSAQKDAIELMESPDWEKEAGSDEIEGIVYARKTRSWGKVFKLVAEVDVDALTYYNDIVYNADDIPKWNPTVLEVRSLEAVDDSTEISYSVAAEGAGGLVSSRDFVSIRHWEQLDGWYVTSSIAVEHPSMPTQSKYVRGEQGPGIFRLQDIGTNKMRMEWLLNSNLKGWLPQYLIDQALSGVMMAYLANLRKYVATMS